MSVLSNAGQNFLPSCCCYSRTLFSSQSFIHFFSFVCKFSLVCQTLTNNVLCPTCSTFSLSIPTSSSSSRTTFTHTKKQTNLTNQQASAIITKQAIKWWVLTGSSHILPNTNTHTPNTNTLHYRIFFSFPSFLFAPFFFQISPLWLALIWSDLYISLNTFLFLFSPPPLSISIQFHLYGHGRRHVITLANRLHSLVSVFFFFSLLLRSPHSPHIMNSFFFFLSRWLPWPWSYTTTTTFSLFTYFFIFLPFL